MLYRNKNLATRNNREEVNQSSLCLQITVNAQNKKKLKLKKKFRYLLWAAFIALMLARIPETNNLKQTKWSWKSQLAWGRPVGYLHLQAWSRIWTRDQQEQIQLAVRARLGLGASELQDQRSNRSA